MKAKVYSKEENDLYTELKKITLDVNATKRTILERYSKTVKIEKKHLKKLLYQRNKILKALKVLNKNKSLSGTNALSEPAAAP